MSNEFFRDLQNDALLAMQKRASELGVHRGVATAFILTDSPRGLRQVAWLAVEGKYERGPDHRKEGDTGVNYLAVAFAKLSQSLSTDMASGQAVRPMRYGETPYRGGLPGRSSSGLDVYSAFSGGTETQDVEIAQAGLDILKTA